MAGGALWGGVSAAGSGPRIRPRGAARSQETPGGAVGPGQKAEFPFRASRTHLLPPWVLGILISLARALASNPQTIASPLEDSRANRALRGTTPWERPEGRGPFGCFVVPLMAA